MKYINETGFPPKLREALNSLYLEGGLPTIRGTWFFVDPYAGSNANGGQSIDEAVADLETAYGLCTSGLGDGIAVLSGGTTTANTTSYLKQSLTWSKHAITVVGIASPTRLFSRARVSNSQVATGSLTTISFADTDGVYTIDRSAGSFVTDGFEAGQMVAVAANSGTNDGNYTIESVAAGSLTVTESVTDEDAATAGATTITSYNPQMIVVSGDNNSFVNLHVGNFSSDDSALGCVKVTGNRNSFIGCHFIGAGHATPGAVATAYDLLLDGAQESTFVNCTFGTDTIIRGAANANIVFDGTVWRSRFYNCEVLSYSATAGKGAVKSADATALSGIQVFKECQFLNWNPNGISASTSAFIGTKPTSGALLMDGCSLVGWAAWDSVGGNDMVYVANTDATASGAGGIATTP